MSRRVARPLVRRTYLLFYVERAECIEVWRVLHASRGIPRWLQHDADPSSR